jgi:cell shape-determining protein MreC
MSGLRFNHVFTFLMSGAFLCAFILPANLFDPARLHAASLFNPLAYPLRRLAQAIYRPPADESGGSRSMQAVLRENDRLAQEVAVLSAEVSRLQRLSAQEQQLGSLQSRTESFPVAQGDSAGRDGLLLKVPPTSHLPQDAAVVYPGGLAGRLDASWGAARVRLITDDGFAVTGAFYRMVDRDGKITPEEIGAPLVKGRGQGRLAITGMSVADYSADGVKIGDWVVLADAAWPQSVQGVRLGRIVSARPSRQTPLFMEIALAPAADLNRLGSVWVVTR